MPTNEIEYEKLYDEIAANAAEMRQCQQYAYAGTAAIITFALGADMSNSLPSSSALLPWALLVPIFTIICPCLISIRSAMNSTVRIAAYLRHAFETERDKAPYWQTKVQELRRKSAARGYITSLKFQFGMLSGLCIVLSFVTLTLPSPEQFPWWKELLFSKSQQATSRCLQLQNAPFGWPLFILYLASVAAGVVGVVLLCRNLSNTWSSESFENVYKDCGKEPVDGCD